VKLTIHRYDGFVVGEEEFKERRIVTKFDGKTGAIVFDYLPTVKIKRSGSESNDVQIAYVKLWSDDGRLFVESQQHINMRVGDSIAFDNFTLTIRP
jgi:antitoxin component YwqK of YwqJK toxin-antitoxin module